jgi:hypothetical protein
MFLKWDGMCQACVWVLGCASPQYQRMFRIQQINPLDLPASSFPHHPPAAAVPQLSLQREPVVGIGSPTHLRLSQDPHCVHCVGQLAEAPPPGHRELPLLTHRPLQPQACEERQEKQEATKMDEKEMRRISLEQCRAVLLVLTEAVAVEARGPGVGWRCDSV